MFTTSTKLGGVSKRNVSQRESIEKANKAPGAVHPSSCFELSRNLSERANNKINLLNTTGVEVAESTICEFLHWVGFTRQKMKLVAKQRDEFPRTQFIDMSLFEPDMLIFVDETGVDCQDTSYATAYMANLWDHAQMLMFGGGGGECLSTLGTMSTSGVLDCKVVRGKVDEMSLWFYLYITTTETHAL